MRDVFDTSELTDFQNDLIELANERMPNETKRFLKKEGVKLKRKTIQNARKSVRKRSGNLFKGIREGKVYKYAPTGALAIRVYAGRKAHHAHLLEYGHRIVSKSGVESGFVPGHHFFEKSKREFEHEYYENVQEFIDDLLEDGLC